MPYREIIAVCSQIHTKHINTLSGQNVELLNVKLAVHTQTTELEWAKTTKFTAQCNVLLPCRPRHVITITTVAHSGYESDSSCWPTCASYFVTKIEIKNNSNLWRYERKLPQEMQCNNMPTHVRLTLFWFTWNHRFYYHINRKWIIKKATLRDDSQEEISTGRVDCGHRQS